MSVGARFVRKNSLGVFVNVFRIGEDEDVRIRVQEDAIPEQDVLHELLHATQNAVLETVQCVHSRGLIHQRDGNMILLI